MDNLNCDQEGLPCRSRLKIRRTFSSKISATSFSSQSSSSFHGSCRQTKKRSCNNIVRQPLIYHTFDPEIIVVEPAEFMWLVQRLTGSPHTRRLLRTSMRKSKEMQSSLRVPSVQLTQQGMHSMDQQSDNDPMREGTTIVLAPTSCSNLEIFINDLNPSPSCPNPSENIHHAPELPLSSHAFSEESTRQPLSACAIMKKSKESLPLPLSAKASGKLSNTRGPPCSPNSSLTTSSEGYHTDNLSSTEGGADPSPYREAFCLNEEALMEAEEDGSTSFFVFSGDSYYGTYNHAIQDAVELHYSNSLDSSPQFSMPFGTPPEASNLSFLQDSIEEEANYS